VGIPLEMDGVDLAAFEAAIKKETPKLFYIVPDFQNPAGVTTWVEKRQRIARLAREYGFLIVEDAPYRFLRYQGENLPRFLELVPEKTLHISSFSKIMSPGLRVGFLIGPKDIMPKFHQWSEDTYIHPTLVTEGIVYEYCRRGLLEPNIESLKALYAPRKACMLKMLDKYCDTHMADVNFIRPEGGILFIPQPSRIGRWPGPPAKR
jgi:2-aminoadipate transaminase